MVAKRLFDLIVSALGMLVLLPLFAAIAVIIRVDSPGPVFFRQIRIGRYGVPFTIFKFRTMVTRTGPATQITADGDPRITASGRVLRHFKLDELPQLLNVLRGEMSLVGPRPEVPRYFSWYSEEQRRAVLSVPPGITDWAAIHYRDESVLLAAASDPERRYVEDILPVKIGYYCTYVRERNFWTDLKIIFLTLLLVFGKNTRSKA